jgi:hypothetical protein
VPPDIEVKPQIMAASLPAERRASDAAARTAPPKPLAPGCARACAARCAPTAARCAGRCLPGLARLCERRAPLRAAALQAGASACLVEADHLASFGFDDARIAALRGLKAAAGRSRTVLGPAQRAAAVVATTGTNGKTSTAWWTAQALTLPRPALRLVGTLGIGEPPPASPAAGDAAAA